MVLFRNDTADDFVLDLDALAALIGRDVDNSVAVLAATAGLSDELALAFGGKSDCFTVGNLRCTNAGIYLKLAQ